jgi:hypothetical protein
MRPFRLAVKQVVGKRAADERLIGKEIGDSAFKVARSPARTTRAGDFGRVYNQLAGGRREARKNLFSD